MGMASWARAADAHDARVGCTELLEQEQVVGQLMLMMLG